MSVEITDDPSIVRFNINKLKAYTPSLTFRGENRGDVMLVLGSAEKSAGVLNINTGDVRGAASLKAVGEDFDDPFPVAVAYRGNLNFTTSELNLEVSGVSFEPVKLKEPGLYQKIQPEKFWNAVHLYTIWDETNDTGKKELAEVMTAQLMAQFPEERAEEIAETMAREVMDMVDEVRDVHEDLKDEGFDFSKLDLIQ